MLMKDTYSFMVLLATLKGSTAFPSGPGTGWMFNVCRTEATVMNREPSLNQRPGHFLSRLVSDGHDEMVDVSPTDDRTQT